MNIDKRLKEFDKKFVKGYGDGKVDWTYPEEGNVRKFIEQSLQQVDVEVGDLSIRKSHRDNFIWIEQEDGEGGEFEEKKLHKVLREFYNKHF